MSTQDYVLYGQPGWGSAIVEAQLAWYGLPFRYEPIGDLFASAESRDRLRPLNPLTQVPTLLLPDGQVMTESAAITLLLADLTGRDDLVPGPGAAERPAFLRWLVFLVANIYPCFTYADVPERFVKAPGAGEGFKQEVNEYQKRLWSMVEPNAGSPHFLGARFSALDIYLVVMGRWRPGAKWFAEHAPKLAAATQRASAMPQFAEMIKRNFPG